jgi:hypothetical protein
MYWLALAMLAALGGTFYKSSRSAEAPGGEYSTHLTKAEKQTLAKGKVVLKTHWAYNDIWHSGYHTGPLQVRQLPGGKLRFVQFGHWQDFHKGRLSYEADYFPPYRSAGKVYDEAGEIRELIWTQPIVVKTDTIVEVQVIYLDFYKRADTLVVQHLFQSKDYQRIAEPAAFWSYDVAGKHPVPRNWKFQRY